MVPYSVSSSCHSLKREVEMYFHFFLLMLHLCSFLLRELSCESRPYPPSSFSSRSSAPVRPGFCRSPGSPCRERRGGRVPARWPVAGGRWSVVGGRWPVAGARCPLRPSQRSALRGCRSVLTLWLFIVLPGPVPPPSPAPASLLLTF